MAEAGVSLGTPIAGNRRMRTGLRSAAPLMPEVMATVAMTMQTENMNQ